MHYTPRLGGLVLKCVQNYNLIIINQFAQRHILYMYVYSLKSNLLETIISK